MEAPDDLTIAGRRGPWHVRLAAAVAVAALAALTLTGCSGGASGPNALANPAHSIYPDPDYPDVCAPIGADSSSTCLRMTLQAVDSARAVESMRPMVLPADFPRLTAPEQLFVAIDRERVDRGLPPFAGLTTQLNANARRGASSASLPPRPGRPYDASATEWIGAVDNGLDADYQWMYDDGRGSGLPGCSARDSSNCWADRQIVLDRFEGRHLVMGAAFDPSTDISSGRGGSSLAATLAANATRPRSYEYTWRDAQAAMRRGTLRPLRSIPRSESGTGIPNPKANVTPVPDFTRACASNGIDDSARCTNAALAAINHAHALEGIRPMVLPAGFAQLSIPNQLLVAVDLERVDRGLPPFGGLIAALNENAQRGANDANDPPEPGQAYVLDDAEWAGGSSNGLDAVYGWMYDDGYNSGNLDCQRRSDAGCWGHRKGILDDFGSGPNLVMGAAVDTSADTHRGDHGGTSMAITLAVASAPTTSYTYSWAQAIAAIPG
jgi:hypothetical protein